MYLCTLLSVLWSAASRIVASLGESLNVGSFGFITSGESNLDMKGGPISAVAAWSKAFRSQRKQARCRIRLFGGPPIRQECICALSCPNYIRAGVPSGPLLVALLLLYIVSHHVGQELLRMHIWIILGTLFQYLSHAYQCNMSAILAVMAG